MTDVLAKISHIIAQVLHKGIEELELDAMFADQGIDEFDIIELIMKLEDHFGILIEDEKAATFNTLQDIIDYIIDAVE